MKKIALFLLILCIFTSSVECQRLILKPSFVKPFQDSIKISILEAENALMAKRNYESCSVLRIKDAEIIEILRTQNKEILDSLQSVKMRNAELVNKLKDKEVLLKESEAKVKKKRRENWIWRLGFVTKILIALL